MSVKQIQQLRKVVFSQKKTWNISTPFSYRFDPKTDKLILNYSIRIIHRKNGKMVNTQKRIQKYFPTITTANWKKFFDGDRSVIRDDAKYVENEINKHSAKTITIDENDWNYWIQNYITRTTGQTKTLKKLSPLTTKQNKLHLEQYYVWLIQHDPNSSDIHTHIDKGVFWFEKYYQYKLDKGDWANETVHTSFRNIRGFYNYVSMRSKIDFPYNILRRLQIPQATNTRDKLNSVEFAKVVDFINEKKDHLYWNKFVLMLSLQMKTGMRISELCFIKKSAVNLDLKQITILGKGDKIRKLNFVDKADKGIWKSIVKQYNISDEGIYLFFRTRLQYFSKTDTKKEITISYDKPTTDGWYSKKFREMRSELGLRDIITSHSLRRYFITEFLKTNSKDLTKQIVGHSSDEMINKYIGDMIEEETTTTIDIGI